MNVDDEVYDDLAEKYLTLKDALRVIVENSYDADARSVARNALEKTEND